MGLSGVERRLERLVEGSFAKVFRSSLEPLEIGRRLVREIDRGRQRSVHGVIAPNELVVGLSAADLDRFSGYADTLVHELEEAARQHVREEGYGLLGPLVVELVRQPSLRAGELRVEGRVAAATTNGLAASVVLPGGRRRPLGDHVVTIGRDAACEITLDDTTVSRRHAEIRRADAGFQVIDLASRNGTKVNGRAVPRAALRDGDEILVGAVALRFETV